MTKMQQTVELGCEFWNDSCSIKELTDAVQNGATGATSNPVIVGAVVKGDLAIWGPIIDELVQKYETASEDEITWHLIERMGIEAAKILEPIYQSSEGRKGYLSIQVNPKFYRNSQYMFEHGRRLAAFAPNIAIKAPVTPAGITAMENLIADGINCNATVCFSVAQAVCAAEAFERGIDRALQKGLDIKKIHPYVTIMVGRVDDHMQRVIAKEGINIDPGLSHWAGIAVFKKAREIFKKKEFRSELLVAAYRHSMHWSELLGKDVVQTIPYAWWKQFNKSEITPSLTLDRSMDIEKTTTLYKNISDFRKAFDDDGLKPSEFANYGATIHTLQQFLNGYQELVALVRERMLGR